MLQHAVSQAAVSYGAYRSGLVRLEVCPALWSLLSWVPNCS